jgi:hypothetical protein
MPITLQEFISGFARGLQLADAKRPVASSARSDRRYSPGIGPHSETATVLLAMQALSEHDQRFHAYALGVPYPNEPRQKCDLCLGVAPDYTWCVEIKMIRILGDNGKPNDNILMHVMSPYPQHRSALTDCRKLQESGFHGRRAILIYGYDANGWPLEPAIDAFETLAARLVTLGRKQSAKFTGLVHPIHRSGAVFGWEIG